MHSGFTLLLGRLQRTGIALGFNPVMAHLRRVNQQRDNAGARQDHGFFQKLIFVGQRRAFLQPVSPDDRRKRAAARLTRLHDAGVSDARLYLADESDGICGAGAFFLLLDEPEVYRLPPDPVTTTRDLGGAWKAAGVAALSMVAGIAAAFVKAR